MNKKEELIVVGITSNFGSFICNYPYLVMIIVIFVGEIFASLFGADTTKLIRGLAVMFCVFLPLIFIIYLISNKWCYKIEVDNTNGSIIFYRLCNRDVRSLPLCNIKIVIDSYCHIIINDSEFILHAEYIHDLVSHLPKDTIIEYKGNIGKYKENNWEKGPLVPGKRL